MKYMIKYTNNIIYLTNKIKRNYKRNKIRINKIIFINYIKNINILRNTDFKIKNDVSLLIIVFR